jgi:hypothetical protein
MMLRRAHNGTSLRAETSSWIAGTSRNDQRNSNHAQLRGFAFAAFAAFGHFSGQLTM